MRPVGTGHAVDRQLPAVPHCQGPEPDGGAELRHHAARIDDRPGRVVVERVRRGGREGRAPEVRCRSRALLHQQIRHETAGRRTGGHGIVRHLHAQRDVVPTRRIEGLRQIEVQFTVRTARCQAPHGAGRGLNPVIRAPLCQAAVRDAQQRAVVDLDIRLRCQGAYRQFGSDRAVRIRRGIRQHILAAQTRERCAGVGCQGHGRHQGPGPLGRCRHPGIRPGDKARTQSRARGESVQRHRSRRSQPGAGAARRPAHCAQSQRIRRRVALRREVAIGRHARQEVRTVDVHDTAGVQRERLAQHHGRAVVVEIQKTPTQHRHGARPIDHRAAFQRQRALTHDDVARTRPPGDIGHRHHIVAHLAQRVAVQVELRRASRVADLPVVRIQTGAGLPDRRRAGQGHELRRIRRRGGRAGIVPHRPDFEAVHRQGVPASRDGEAFIARAQPAEVE